MLAIDTETTGLHFQLGTTTFAIGMFDGNHIRQYISPINPLTRQRLSYADNKEHITGIKIPTNSRPPSPNRSVPTTLQPSQLATTLYLHCSYNALPEPSFTPWSVKPTVVNTPTDTITPVHPSHPIFPSSGYIRDELWNQDLVVFQNAPFDLRALAESGVIDWNEPCDPDFWSNIIDLNWLLHLVDSSMAQSSSLKTIAPYYLGVNYSSETFMDTVVDKFRSLVRTRYPHWQIGNEYSIPFAQPNSKFVKTDMWLPYTLWIEANKKTSSLLDAYKKMEGPWLSQPVKTTYQKIIDKLDNLSTPDWLAEYSTSHSPSHSPSPSHSLSPSSPNPYQPSHPSSHPNPHLSNLEAMLPPHVRSALPHHKTLAALCLFTVPTYLRDDCVYTYNLAQHFGAILTERHSPEQLEDYLNVNRSIAACTWEMEVSGLFVHQDQLNNSIESCKYWLNKLHKQCEKISGIKCDKFTDDRVRHYLFTTLGLEPTKVNKPSKKFPEGAPSVDGSTIIELKKAADKSIQCERCDSLRVIVVAENEEYHYEDTFIKHLEDSLIEYSLEPCPDCTTTTPSSPASSTTSTTSASFSSSTSVSSPYTAPAAPAASHATNLKVSQFLCALLSWRKYDKKRSYLEGYKRACINPFTTPISHTNCSQTQPVRSDRPAPLTSSTTHDPTECKVPYPHSPYDITQFYTQSLPPDSLFLFPNLKICGTSTLRISAQNPTTQVATKGTNPFEEEFPDVSAYLSNSPHIRSIFGPPPGYIWLSFDYKQLQLCIFAYATQEESLMQAFVEDKDFHNHMASLIFSSSEPSKAQRRIAKNVNFGFIFGASERKIDSTANEHGFYNELMSMFPNAHQFIQETRNKISASGVVHTLNGYPLHVPLRENPWSPGDYTYAAHIGVNYIVQGTEGHIVKIAMANCHSYLHGHPYPFPSPRLPSSTEEVGGLTGCRVVMQVHDELNFLIPCPDVRSDELPPDVMLIASDLKRIMEDAAIQCTVPADVDCELIKHNWASPIKLKV